ncbi:MAG: hypothetical protein A3E85_04760 [Gammaproteobacteria bacterium RIFCSPHIGHO2_12_FULL_45_12]|nr:MAG: hypothetical protein A3E85_04760 [Gammaproteobacteria bacterium RIFCSPHIGHO2_12_FULL_45_12]
MGIGDEDSKSLSQVAEPLLIPKDRLDFDVCLEWVRQDGDALQHLEDYKAINLTDEQFNKIYLQAVIQKPTAIQYIPVSRRNEEISLKAAQGDIHALVYVPEAFLDRDEFKEVIKAWQSFALDDIDLLKGVSEKLFTHAFCDALVRLNTNYTNSFKYIPKQYLSHSVFKAGIHSPYQALRAMPFLQCYKQTTSLTEEEYRSLIRAIVKDYFSDSLFRGTPSDMRHDILTELVNQDKWVELKCILRNRKAHIYSDESILLTSQEYKIACLTAVRKKGEFIKDIPTQRWDPEICSESIKQRHDMIDYIVKTLGASFNSDQYREFSLEVVRQNPKNLAHIDDQYKSFVIDTLDPEKILMTDYDFIKHFPPHYPLQAVLEKLLPNIVHVVVTGDGHYDCSEIRDSFAVYANAPARKGKTLHISAMNLNRLLDDIMKYQGGNGHLNLVLLGHTSIGSESIAEKSVSQIVDLLADHAVIKRVTLLGCNTVRAKPLEQEIEMGKKYRESLLVPEKNTYSGVILMSDYPDKDMQNILFKKTCSDKDRDQTDTVFVFINNKPSLISYVLLLKKDEITGHISEQRYDLNDVRKIGIGKLIGKRWDRLPFPSIIKPPIYYFGGMSREFLSPRKTEKLVEILNLSEPRFSKRHPQYKWDKKRFPFMRGVAMNEAEQDKLDTSLLKKLVDAIKAEPRVKREVEVKGYTRSLHVDMVEEGFRGSRSNIYEKEYRYRTPDSFFGRSSVEIKPNIIYKQMYAEIKSEMDRMAKGVEQPESSAKSIIVTVTPKNPWNKR